MKAYVLLALLPICIFGGCTTAPKQTPNKPASQEPPKHKEGIRLNVPIYAQKISIQLPSSSWNPINENRLPAVYKVELAPNNEDPSNWKNLVSIQGLKGAIKAHERGENSAVPLRTLISSVMRKAYGALCPKEKFILNIGGEININTDKYLGITMGCLVPSKVKPSKTPINQGELGYFIIVEGEEDLYIIHRAIRGSEAFLTQSLQKGSLENLIRSIEPIQLCEKTGHAADCQH